jgi:hypothetical protein
MTQPWVILTRRTGQDVRSPTPAQLAEAIAELYHETLPWMTEEGYAEHGAAFLRLGWDDGPMYVLEVNRLRDATFEEWADQDYEHELAPPRTMRKVAEQAALRLWTWLAEAQVDRVRSQPWDGTP